MQYNNRNIVLNELIGLKVRVAKCTDLKQIGTRGVVVDETKNTLAVDTGSKVLRIAKASAEFRFYVGNKSFLVAGREINFRPDERTEKALRFYKRRSL